MITMSYHPPSDSSKFSGDWNYFLKRERGKTGRWEGVREREREREIKKLRESWTEDQEIKMIKKQSLENARRLKHKRRN